MRLRCAQPLEFIEGLDATPEALELCKDLTLYNGAKAPVKRVSKPGVLGYVSAEGHDTTNKTEEAKTFLRHGDLGKDVTMPDGSVFKVAISGVNRLLYDLEHRTGLSNLVEVKPVPADHPAAPGFGVYAKVALSSAIIFGPGAYDNPTPPIIDYGGTLAVEDNATGTYTYAVLDELELDAELKIDAEAEPRCMAAYMNCCKNGLVANVEVTQLLCTGGCFDCNGERRPFGTHPHIIMYMKRGAVINTGDELIIDYGPHYPPPGDDCDEEETSDDDDSDYDDEVVPRPAPAPVEDLAALQLELNEAKAHTRRAKRALEDAEERERRLARRVRVATMKQIFLDDPVVFTEVMAELQHQ